jgi:predicted RNase H-like nuclease (RuvC/YqgF family)
MSDLSKRRSKLITSIQRAERREYLDKMR